VIGREPELEMLRQSLDWVVSGAGGTCVALVGEAGVGKTRLVDTLVGWARDDVVRVAVGTADRGSSRQPYKAIVDALVSVAGDGPELLAEVGSARAAVIARLVPTLNLEPAVEVSPPLVADAVLGVTGTRPTVLVLEDMHWADPETIATVAGCTARLAGVPVLMVVTIRGDEAGSDWLVSDRRISVVDIPRLDARESEAMAAACGMPGAGELTRVADGLPLLIEELVTDPAHTPTFQAIVADRLGRLDSRTRDLVLAASLMGASFDWSLLPAATGFTEEAVDSGLAEAVGVGLLEIRGIDYRFRHDLASRAVLDEATPPRVRRVARSMAEGLSDSDVDDGLVAGLWRRAGEDGRAGVLLARAGRAALLAGHVETARVMLGDAFEAVADPRLGLDLLASLAACGDRTAVLELGARLIVELTGEPDLLFGVYLTLARVDDNPGRVTGHLAAASRLAAGDGLKHAAWTIAEANATLAGLRPDRAARARSLAEEAAEAAMELGSMELACDALELVGRCARPFDLELAESAFERMYSIAPSELTRFRALNELGTIDLLRHADSTRIAAACQAALTAGAQVTALGYASDAADLGVVVWGLCRATSALLTEDRPRALAAFERAAEAQRRSPALMNDPFRGQWLLVRLVEGTAGPGDLAELALLGPGCVFHRMFSGYVSALVAGRSGHPTEALRRFAEAEEAAALCPIWRYLSLRLLAEAALSDGWGEPVAWLLEAESWFVAHGHPKVTSAIRGLLRRAGYPVGRGRGPETDVPDHLRRRGVTAREAEVLALVADHLSNRQIAERLYLSVRTVDRHVANLLTKLDASSRAQLGSSVER
jgi:DNA-binding CsgD family transcriptional regulator